VPGIGSQCASASSGASQDAYLGPGQWQISVGYRWQRSHRHFRGTEEQKEREEQHTEIVNNINLIDITTTYAVSPRFSLNLSVPFIFASRTRPGELDRSRGFPNAPDQIVNTLGIGDVSFSGRMWLIRPPSEDRQNVSIGFGIKLPTGDPGVKDTVVNAAGVRTRSVVDQSIQPGDGGVGMLLDVAAFKAIRRVTVFGGATYLMNPRNTNGVRTGRGRASEAIMSVADQYLARGGVVTAFPKVHGLALSLAGRIEGVPATDVLGKNDGFRRPGYAVSLEPGFIYSRGKDSWTLNVPVALLRNRTRSISDIRDNTHGDAAFADYFITFGYSRRF
jgi:hypothetical protein